MVEVHLPRTKPTLTVHAGPILYVCQPKAAIFNVFLATSLPRQLPFRSFFVASRGHQSVNRMLLAPFFAIRE